MKLVIGTAQLGENYGIAFPGKKIQKSEFIKILDLAQKNKIQSIDTAAAYGDSQEILGEIGINGMCVTTKLPKIPEDILKKDINLWLNSTLKKILDDLKLNTIDVLLIHYINDLLGKFSNDLI